ncbi:MAG TPA: dihydrofolate reductase [Candidatus Paceibacterota bacterium]|nr:dihydrofolate reductase [Candidatus Paceibacterota bacterium]
MKISLIAAMGENRVIGAGGKIPWHLPADFKHFKEITMGHPVIMGRKTFESIGKPLPGRTNIVITANPGYKAEGCLMARSMEEALKLAGNADEAFVIGGEQIYRAALDLAETVYLTKVHGTFDGDAFFPELDEKKWKLIDTEFHAKDEKNPFDYAFLIYSAA